MNAIRLYQNAQIAGQHRGDPVTGDVLVEGGVIRRVGPSLALPMGAAAVDCRGKILLPSLWDVNVHARESPAKAAEAAIAGGFTGIVLMPDSDPPVDSANQVRAVLDKARDCRIEVRTAGCITSRRKGRKLAGIAGMKAAGASFLSDGGAVENPQVMRRAMEYAKNFHLVVASHCETLALTAGGAINEGRISYGLGLPGAPAISEEVCLARDILLAQYCQASLHIQQVTTARGVETIRRFKADGVDVTCEVSPHHLIFNETHLAGFDTSYKVNPPLRTEADSKALLDGLQDGTIDLIATQHSPHTEFEKLTDFQSAPYGMMGLQTALPALYHYLVKPGKMDWGLLVKSFCSAPRRLLGQQAAAIREGAPADFVVFDGNGKSHFTKSFLRSECCNTPFLDQELCGMVEQVVFRGRQLTQKRQFEEISARK